MSYFRTLLRFLSPSWLRPGFEKAPVADQNKMSLKGPYQEETLQMQKVEALSTIDFPCGQRQKGEFHNGLLHGQGEILFPNGEWQVGQFSLGELTQGKIAFPDGERQEGLFQKGFLHGAGKVTFPNGEIQTGHFLQGQLDGEGVILFAHGEEQHGSFKKGLLEGEGRRHLPNGVVFEGTFHQGSIEGPGKVILSDGLALEGHFHERKFLANSEEEAHLECSCFSSWSKQRQAAGEQLLWLAELFSVDQLEAASEGEQTLVSFPSEEEDQPLSLEEENKRVVGLLLEGQIEDGTVQGCAKVILSNGKLIYGHFEQGRLEGYAIITTPEGTVRQGHYRKNRLHGPGALLLPTGEWLKGIFNKGKLVIYS